MKRIAQWSLLFVMVALTGFGATLLAARSVQFADSFGSDGSVVEVGTADDAVVVLDTLSASALGADTEPAAEQEMSNNAATDESVSQAAAHQISADSELSAVGAIEVKDERDVVLGASARVDEVLVDEGVTIQSGDILARLDTTYLDWEVEQAEIGFETARINFEELGDLIEDSDIELARAQLLQAQEDLAEVEAGPTTEELAAAQSAANAAWAAYEETQNKPLPAQVNMALATKRKAEISLQQAQREFDKIAWLPESAASDAADNLQRATIDLEAAKSAYEEASKPATEAELQSALSKAQSAQDSLNQLLEMPTPAQLAAAKAGVLAAETDLQKLEDGPKESALRKGELAVRTAMIGLEQARLQREYADVTAPIDGVVLAINLDVGQEASAGSVAAILADTENLRLTVNVEQKDIGQVSTGQLVTVSVFALPDESFVGTVERIAPTASSGTGFVTFPVVIVLTDGPLDKLLPGMTASAVFDEATVAAQDSVSEEETSDTTPAEEQTPDEQPTPTDTQSTSE